MRKITLDEHYATPAFLKDPGQELEERSRSGGFAAGFAEFLLRM
jgi:hypothetical protein